jgi:hypothetical protein
MLALFIHERSSQMGAWGTGNFDNDTACDWVYELQETDDVSLVRNTLADVGEDYLDSDVACMALAACEVIARLKGQWGPRNSYTEDVDKWVEAHPQKVPADLVQQAVKVIDRILGPESELSELWKDGDTADEWQKVVDDLRRWVQA